MRMRPILLLLLAFVALAMPGFPPTQAFATNGGETELFMQGPGHNVNQPTEASGEDEQNRSTVATAGTVSKETSPQTGDPISFVPLALVSAGCGLVIVGKVTRRRRNLPTHQRTRAADAAVKPRHGARP